MLPESAVEACLYGLVDVIELPLPGRSGALLVPGSPPTLYLDPGEQKLPILLDTLRVLILGEGAAQLGQPVIPPQRTGPTSHRHLRPVS